MLARIYSKYDSHTSLITMKNGTTNLENFWLSFIELNIHLPNDPSCSIPSNFPRERKIQVCEVLCTRLFISALITKMAN